MVLDVTTRALSDMNTHRGVLNLVRQANLELSAIEKSSRCEWLAGDHGYVLGSIRAHWRVD